jgi:hypothetical protein
MFKGHFTKDHSLPTLSLTNPQKYPRIDQLTQNQTGDVWWELPLTLHPKSVLL